jgi:hypothetical protein
VGQDLHIADILGVAEIGGEDGAVELRMATGIPRELGRFDCQP